MAGLGFRVRGIRCRDLTILPREASGSLAPYLAASYRTFRTLAGGFLEKVFDGAVDEYLVHAIQSRRLSVEELDRLEEMLADADGEKRQQKK